MKDGRNILVTGFDRKEFGRRIRLRRKELGKSQEWLAEQLDWSKAHVDNIEKGVRGTTAENVLLLAQALRTTPNFLLATNFDNEPDGEQMLLRERIMARIEGCSAEEIEVIDEMIAAVLRLKKK